jgi:hypothetical protein
MTLAFTNMPKSWKPPSQFQGAENNLVADHAVLQPPHGACRASSKNGPKYLQWIYLGKRMSQKVFLRNRQPPALT